MTSKDVVEFLVNKSVVEGKLVPILTRRRIPWNCSTKFEYKSFRKTSLCMHDKYKMSR